MKNFILLFILLITACKPGQVPSEILPQEKMEAILYDIFIAEALNSVRNTDGKSDFLKENAVAYTKIFSIHNVSKDTFYKSYNYYLGRPDLFGEMMSKITLQLEAHKKEEEKKFFKNLNPGTEVKKE